MVIYRIKTVNMSFVQKEKDLLGLKKKIVWTKSHTRETYLDYYKENLESRPYLWGIPLDSKNSDHDILLVARVHEDHNRYLASIKQELPENFYDSLNEKIATEAILYGGHLFETHCCKGWFYGMYNCLCGNKAYLSIDIFDLTNFKVFNLQSITPIGTVTLPEL